MLQSIRPFTFRDTTKFRNQLEASWATFLSAWGVPFEYNPKLYQEERDDTPPFYITSSRVWLEVHPRESIDEHMDILKSKMRFVDKLQRPVLCAFGKPTLRIPDCQGWGLKPKEDGVAAFPFHLLTCPTCGGFSATSLDMLDTQEKDPGTYLQMLACATQLESAYEQANSIRYFSN